MIYSSDKNEQIDGVVYSILKHIPTKIPLVPVTRIENFVFNDELYKLKEYILFDYIEYGANSWDRKQTHFFGKNTSDFSYCLKGKEWKLFDEFVKKHPPVVYFKRELLQKDFSGNVYPIEFPCWQPVYATQLKEDFDKRPIELFHFWGHSHESRRMFQGNAYLHAVKNNITIADNIHYLGGVVNENKGRIWATMNIPHFARIQMDNIMGINNVSKLSLSLPGCGVKCFRHSESPVNSVMVMQEDNLAWSYPWVHGENCIKVPIGDSMDDIRGLSGSPEIQAIEEAIKRDDLYNIYVSGLQNIDNYRMSNYANNYIIPIIKKHDH